MAIVVMNLAFRDRSTGLLLSISNILRPKPDIIPAGLVCVLFKLFLGSALKGFLSFENSNDS